MRTSLTVTLAQCDAVLGDVPRNLEAMLGRIEAARSAGSGLVVFPELSLTGYHLRDLTPEVALRAGDMALTRLAEASRDVDVVAGWIEESAEHGFYNVAGYFSEGRILHVHRKVYPVNYGMFEERRDWAAGDQVAAFDTRWGRAGLLICEDLWHPSTSYLLFCDRADVIITVSASPARGVGPRPDDALSTLGSARNWEGLLRHQSAAFTLYSVYVNRAGVEDGTCFAGHSLVADPFGEIALRMGLDDEDGRVVLDPQALRRRRAALPMLRDERIDVTLGNLQRIAHGRFGAL